MGVTMGRCYMGHTSWGLIVQSPTVFRMPQMVAQCAPVDSALSKLPHMYICPVHSRTSGYACAHLRFLARTPAKEVCAYSMACKNNEELFRVGAEQPFRCQVDERGFRRLQGHLAQGPAERGRG